MPELPEVETIVRELDRKITGKKLSRFFVYDKKLSKPPVKLPVRVSGVHRRGKYIVFDLRPVRGRDLPERPFGRAGGSQRVPASNGVDCGHHCVVHLRMTGQLFYEKFADKRGLGHGAPSRTNAEKIQSKSASGLRKSAAKHERARFVFSDGSVLRFFDMRRFGTFMWPRQDVLPQLGVEPLSGKFDADHLMKLLKTSGRPIKNFLLDQKNIAGIGNIYADEALWTAKINPKRKARSLNVREVRKLVCAVRKVLREAIKKGGFTLRDYRRTGGESGYYQHSRRVYDREGLACLPRAESRGHACGGKIRRIKLGGRSSYFCPKCQK
ncbi:MAG: bifunctional DNA-formamidopyrimidine glycosylase/DNA-(apurinic or apyrimidinic site) lyase [Patescibacteria group bacterium]